MDNPLPWRPFFLRCKAAKEGPNNATNEHVMRLNYETVLVGRRVVLVPYRPEHLPTYHGWMADPHLLEMTGSEPLSMEEEIAMQEEWRDDDKKCTFIVLDREACVDLPPPVAVENGAKVEQDDGGGKIDDGENSHDRGTPSCCCPTPAAGGADLHVAPDFVEKNLGAMVGDVNLFLSEEEPDTDDENDDVCVGNNTSSAASVSSSSQHAAESNPRQQIHMQAELDIMIAEESARGKGMGSEASLIMLWYGAHRLKIRRFFAKIKKENDASKGLFEHRLGFREIAFAECFGEHEYERREECSEDMADKLQKELGFEVGECNCKLVD